MRNSNGQIWIETVLYTLIGLVLIALALAFIGPKISEKQDQIAVEQALTTLDKIDENLNIGQGNIREVYVLIKRGQLIIDPVNDRIIFEFDDLSKPYSQPGLSISEGNKILFSEQNQKKNSLKITLNYIQKANITYNNKEEEAVFQISPSQYRLFISNDGDLNGDGINEINIVEASLR